MAKVQNNNVSKSKITGTSTSSVPKRSAKSKSIQKNKVEAMKKEISGIIIIAIAIFLIIMTNKNSQTGIIGKTVSFFSLSSLGKGAYVLPYAILLIGIMKVLDMIIFNDKNQSAAIIILFTCYIMYSALTDTAVYAMLTGNEALKHIFTSSVEFGKNNIGGGLIGNILTFVCVKLVGKNGTIIVLCTLVFVCVILITNQSLISAANIVLNFVRKICRAVYSFVFVDVDEGDTEEDENPKKSRSKVKELKHSGDASTNDNLKVFDYTTENHESIPQFSSNKITSLTLDDKVKKPGKLQKSKKSKESDSKTETAQQHENIKTEFNSSEPVETVSPISDLKTDDSEIKLEKTVNHKKENTFEAKAVTDDIINISGAPAENSINQYKLPTASFLNPVKQQSQNDKEDLRKDAETLIQTLANFNIQCNIVQINKGPTITRYELQPAPGIKVSRITSLANDLALSLATSDIRMEAPIPGKSAIGIEVPNKIKSDVLLRSLIESKEYKEQKSKVPFAIGKDIAGKSIVGNIEKMPHLLVAGATGSGKSVCINSLIMSILFRAKPDEVKLILIDPKVVELSVYNGIPHLLIPVVTDPRKASNALNWAVSEMMSRYKIFAKNSVRDIFTYNAKIIKENKDEKMPQIVIIIDELADLMAVASSEVEESITRIAQLARACGIHLVIATQRPSVDVITGTIKANIPSRIAFAVSSYIDSRTILDTSGAEKLLGKGDMLYHPMGMSKPIRVQGTYISDDEIKRVVDNIKEQKIAIMTNTAMEEIEKPPKQEENVDVLLAEITELVVSEGQASASYLQRKFKVGYSRAARIIDQLEERGIIGGSEGSKPRKVLITKEELDEMRGNE